MAENQPKENIQQPAKKKTSRLKVVLIILALLFSLLVLKVILLITAKPTISVDYLAEFNRISKPADYDPNENAAPYYQKAFDVLTNIYADMQDIWRVLPADMNDSQIEFLEQWLQSNSHALAYLNEAIQKPYYWVQVQSEDNSLKHIDLSHLKFLQAAYCLKFQARLNAVKGHTEQAFHDVINLRKMNAHLYHSNILVAQLQAMSLDGLATVVAFEILNNSKMDSKMLADFQSRFEQSSQVRKPFSFGGEKIFDYDAIQHVFTDDGSGDGRLIPHKLFKYHGYPNTLRGLYSKPRFYFTTAGIYLKILWVSLNHRTRRETVELVEEVYELLDELVKKTPWELHQKRTSHEEQVQKLTKSNYFVRTRNGFKGNVCQIYQRIQAKAEALIATIAILRYKADNGKLPRDLQELVSAGYLKNLPIDPFGPGPLTYTRVTEDDFTLYSFGADFDDDGGVRSKWGLGKQGGDQVFWPVSRKQK